MLSDVVYLSLKCLSNLVFPYQTL